MYRNSILLTKYKILFNIY